MNGTTFKRSQGAALVSYCKNFRHNLDGCWWTASVDGKINLVMRYGSKPLEFAKGKNAIELASKAEVADTQRTLVRQIVNIVQLGNQFIFRVMDHVGQPRVAVNY